MPIPSLSADLAGAHRTHVLDCLEHDAPAPLIEDRPDVAQRRLHNRPPRPLVTLPYPERKRHLLNDLGQCLTAERTFDDRRLWALERAADAFLRAQGDTVIKLDVIDRDTRLPIVAPDRVSFRGVARFRRSAPMRYGAKVRTRWMGTPWAPIKVTLHETTVIGRGIRLLGCTGPGWFGTRSLIDSKGHKVSKARTALKRGEVTGTRGVARTGWSLSDRSLPRAWSRADKEQQAAAEYIVRQLTYFAGSLTMQQSDITSLSPTLKVATDGAYAWRVGEHGLSRSYTVQAFARRAALSREDVA